MHPLTAAAVLVTLAAVFAWLNNRRWLRQPGVAPLSSLALSAALVVLRRLSALLA